MDAEKETASVTASATETPAATDREARMRERRRQRLAQHAGAREELITGLRRETPPTAAADAAAGEGAAPDGVAELERLLRGGVVPRVALSPRLRRVARWGVLALVLALAGFVAHALAGVPAARMRVELTTDSGSAWFSRRVAVVDALDRPARFAAGDVVAAHTTAQHDRLVRAVVLDSVPAEVPRDVPAADFEDGEEGEENEENATVREWRVVPHVARHCADGAWLREDAVAGRVLLSLSPLVLFGIVTSMFRLISWALRSW